MGEILHLADADQTSGRAGVGESGYDVAGAVFALGQKATSCP